MTDHRRDKLDTRSFKDALTGKKGVSSIKPGSLKLLNKAIDTLMDEIKGSKESYFTLAVTITQKEKRHKALDDLRARCLNGTFVRDAITEFREKNPDLRSKTSELMKALWDENPDVTSRPRV